MLMAEHLLLLSAIALNSYKDSEWKIHCDICLYELLGHWWGWGVLTVYVSLWSDIVSQ